MPTIPRRSLAAVALTAALAFVANPSPSSAAATTLVPTADATVNQAAPHQTAGTARLLRVDGRHDGNYDYWTYLRFNLGTSTAPITKATLRLYVTDPSTNRPTVARTSGSWTEYGITWAKRPAASGSAVTTTDSVSPGTWLDYDVSSLLPASGQVNLVMRPTGGDGANFSSRTGGHPPQLVIDRGTGGATATPQPTRSATPPPATPAPTTLPTARPSATPPSTPRPTATSTAPAPGGGTVVVAAGDICNGKTNAQRTGDLVRSIPNKAVLLLGDNQYPDGTLSQYKNCYDVTWGSFKSKTKPAPGNHEYHTSGASGYYDYFGSLAGPRGKGYYSFTIDQNWIGVSLNSELSGSGMSAQLTWLDGVLKANTSKHVLAYWHKPRFSSGEHGNTSAVKPLWDVLYKYGADLVLAGHDHDYERFAPMRSDGTLDPNGIRSFVVGTGGAELRSISSKVRGSEVSAAKIFGVLKLTLKSNGYSWQFLPTQGSTFTDSGNGAVVLGTR